MSENSASGKYRLLIQFLLVFYLISNTAGQ